MKMHLRRIMSCLIAITMLVTAMPLNALATSYSENTGSSLETIETVTVTFVDPMGETVTRTVDQDSVLKTSDWPTPTHDGYRLSGWYDGETLVSALDSVGGDMTLTARWTRLFSIVYQDWDGTQLLKVQVEEGTAFNPSSYNGDAPAREGYSFEGWKRYDGDGWKTAVIDEVHADDVVVAQYKELETCTVTIHYLYNDTLEAANDPYVMVVYKGYELDRTVPSKAMLGYTCLTPEVVFDHETISEDQDVFVYYEPSGTTAYVVQYYEQNVDNDEYTLAATEERSGTTGSLTTVTADDAKSHCKPGFKLQTNINICNRRIAADGSTIIRVEYDREIHYVLFETADGDFVEPISGRYGASVTMPTLTPKRSGYTFTGWDKTVTEIGLEDVTIKAGWTANTVSYYVVVWRENADDTDFSMLGKLRFTGKTGEAASYKADTFKDIDGVNIERTVNVLNSAYNGETKNYFTFSEAITAERNGGQAPVIKGDGSTIYNVYYTRDEFTIKFQMDSGICGSKPFTVFLRDGTVQLQDCTTFNTPVYSITAKYEADLNNKYPGNVTFLNMGNSEYNGCSKVNGGISSTEVTSTRKQMDVNLCNVETTGPNAHTQVYRFKFANHVYYDDLYYLLEGLDGNYQEAGYYQRLASNSPGSVQGSSTSKQIKGFTIAGRAVFAVETEDYSLYSDAANRIVSVPWEEGLTYNTISQIIHNGTWYCIKRDDQGYGNSKKYQAVNVSLWWYSRNRHNLTFMNGGEVCKDISAAGVPFDTPLNSFEPATPTAPEGVGKDYTFEGWYKDETFKEKIVWDTALMPDGDLMLYAYWKKPVYEVDFDYRDEATPVATQEVGKGDNAEEMPVPVWAGYRFDYWYYITEDGREQPFTYSIAINHPYTIYAHWTPTAVTYQVSYVHLLNGSELPVYDEDGHALTAPVQDGLVGETVTFDAKVGYDEKGKPLFVNTRSTSIKLTAVNANNVVTFYYERAAEVFYRVAYVDENGVDLRAMTDVKGTDQAYVTENAVNINGYTPIGSYQQTTALSKETDPNHVSDNIIRFVYRKNATGKYTVRYFLQNLNDNGYTEDTEAAQAKENVSLGYTAQAEIKAYPGYVYVSSISKASGTVYTSQGGSSLTLSVYYNRDYLPYAARYVDRATGEELADAVTGTGRFGKTATVFAKGITSYTLESPEETSAVISITAKADDNVHIFYYIQRDDLSYTVRFLDENDNQIATPVNVVKDSSGRYVLLGSEYSYRLENAALVSNEISYHLTDNEGKVPYTRSVTIKEKPADNFIDFHFAQDTYSLTYHANGGENAPTDTNAYKAEDEVTLQDRGSMTNGDYTFVGWSADENVLQQVYTTASALEKVPMIEKYTFVKPAKNGVVYAVWSNINATLTYAVQDGVSYSGTLPESVTRRVGTSVDVADGAGISRTGYTFAGWQLMDSTGALSGAVYGTDTGMAGSIQLSADTTLYAVWTPVQYSIAYHLTADSPTGAKFTNPNTTITYDVTSDALTLADASLAGYRFLGWYTDSKATTQVNVPAIAKGETGDRSFYARFEAVTLQSVTVSGYDDVYDGAAHGVTLNDPNSELLASDTITYSTDNRYTDVTSAGGQSVTVTVKRGGTEIFSGSALVVITQRPVTVTMTSAENLTYTGEEQETATPKYALSDYSAQDKTGVLPDHSISVTPSGDKRTDAGSNAVTAAVDITANGTSVRSNYAVTVVEGKITIAQAASKAQDTSASHVYDGTAASFETPVLTDKQGNAIDGAAVTWKWPDETEWHTTALPTETDVKAMNGKRAESYVLDVRLTHANYAEQTVEATLTVTPAPVLLTADSKLDLPYTLNEDGSAKAWSVTDAHWQVTENGQPKAGMAQDALYAGDSVTYQLKGNTLDRVGKSTVSFDSYAIANADHAKNYTLTTANGLLTVVRGTAEAVIAASDLNKTYTATAYPLPDPTVSVTTEGKNKVDHTSDYTFSYTVNGVAVSGKPEFTDAGTYTVVISAASDLFAAPEDKTVTVVINPAALTVYSGSSSVTYDADEHEVAVLSATEGLQAADHAVQSDDLTLEAGMDTNKATHQGNYPVKIAAASVKVLDGKGADVTANYAVTVVAGGLNISRAPLTVRAVSASAAYDGKSHTLQVTAAQLQGSDALTGYTLTPENATDVGSYTLTPSGAQVGDATDDYTITYEAGTLAILDFGLTGVDTTYDGDVHQVTATISDDLLSLYDVTYNNDSANPEFVNVTDTTVTVTLTPKDPNAGLPTLTHTVSVVIAARRLTLNVNRIDKTYDGQAAALTAALPENVVLPAADQKTIMNSIAYANADSGAVYATPVFTDALSAKVKVTAACDNYIIEPVETSVNIAQRVVTVTVSPKNASYLYDETAHDMTVSWDHAAAGSTTGLLDGHTLTYTGTNLIVTDVTNGWLDAAVDSVSIHHGETDVIGNYSVTIVNAKVQVNRADSLTLTLTPYEGVYDGAAHGAAVASVKDDGREVALDSFTWRFNELENVTRTDVGETQVTVIGTSVDGNYPEVKGTTHITITPRPVTLTVTSSRGNVYDGTAYSVSGTASAYDAEHHTGLLSGHTVSESLVNAVQTDAGDYTVSYNQTATDILSGSASVKSNYTVTYVSGTLEILAAASKAEDTYNTVTYDGTNKTFTLPTLTDEDGSTLSNVTAQWRLSDEDEWQEGQLPEYMLAQSILKDGGQPGTVADYINTPYTVQVKLSAPNYEDATAQASLTILRRAVSIGVTGNSFEYDGSAHSLVETVSDTATGDSAAYGFAAGYENSQTTVTDAQGHSVRVDRATVAITSQTDEDRTACYAVTLHNAAIIVTAQPTQVAAEPVVKTVDYNGAPYDFDLPVLLDNSGAAVTESVTYAYRTDATQPWSSVMPQRENAGDYTVQVRMTSGNYAPLETVTRLVINRLPLTYQVPTAEYPYTLNADDTVKVWTLDASQTALTAGSNAPVNGHVLSGVTLDEQASRGDIGKNETVHVVSGSIMNGTVDVTANYDITYLPGSIEVVAGTADSLITAKELTDYYKSADYTLDAPTVSVKSEDGTAMLDHTKDFTLSYSVTSTAFEGTKTLRTLPHYTDAGVYTVTISATSRKFAAPAPVTVTMTILPQPLTLTAGTVEKPFTYDGSEHQVAAYTVTAGELRGKDTLAEKDCEFAEGLGNKQTDVADRAVRLSKVTLKNGRKDVTANYDITLLDGRIIVEQAVIGAGLTLTGETHVYDGGEHYAILSDQLQTAFGAYSLADTMKADGTPRFTVTYTATPDGGSEGEKTTTAPRFTNVTTQTVTAYVTDTTGNMIIAPASAQVVVTRRPVLVSVVSENSIVYDGLEHTLTGYTAEHAKTEDGKVIGQSGLVGVDDVTATLHNAGPHILPDTYDVTVSDAQMTTGLAGNYSFSYAPGTMVIDRASGIGLTLTGFTGIYDGQRHGYTIAPKLPEGTPYTYTVIAEDGTETTLTDALLAGYVNQGSYPLTVRIASSCYKDTATASATVTINKRPITVTSGSNSAAPYTYDGSVQSVTAAVLAEDSAYPLVAGEEINLDSLTFDTGYTNENTDVCDRAVRLTDVALRSGETDVTDNYAVTFREGRIVIVPSEAAAAAPTAITQPYNGTQYGFVQPVLKDGGLTLTGVTYAYSLDGETFTETMPQYIDVNRDASGGVSPYEISVRMSQPNYVSRTVKASLTIEPAAITVTADSSSYPYTIDRDGKAILRSITTAQITAGQLYENAAPDYTFRNNTRSQYGSQAVLVDGVTVTAGTTDKTGNYIITRQPGTLTIAVGDDDTAILAEGRTVTYDGTAYSIAAPSITVKSDADTSVVMTDEFTLSYTVRAEGSDEVKTYTKLSDAAFTEANTYHITVSASCEQYKTPADVTVDLVIRARTLNITSEDNSAAPYTYNGKTQQVKGDWLVENLVDGHKLGTLTYAEGQSNAQTAAADRAVLLTGAVVLSGRKDVTANYRINYIPGRIVVKPLTVSAESIGLRDVEEVYDGNAYGLILPKTIRTSAGTLNLADLQAAYTFAGTQTTDNPAFIDVGAYPVTVSLTDPDGNFVFDPAAAQVIITRRALTITYGSDTVPYDAQSHAVTRTVTGLVPRDAITVTDVNLQATEATRLADDSFGALVVTAESYQLTDAVNTAIDRSGNYDVSVKDGSLEITPLTLTVTADNGTYVYNAASQAVETFTVRGSVPEGQTVNVVLTQNASVDVVSRQPVLVDSVTVTDGSGADVTRSYVVETRPGRLTVNPAPLTLGVTNVNVAFDGAAHSPVGYVIGGLQGADTLADYTLNNMPQTAVGVYRRVSYDKTATLVQSPDGRNVTANYSITYETGTLTITAAAAVYTVEYYYDGVLGDAIDLVDTLGKIITTYPTRPVTGYTFYTAEGAPLMLVVDEASNVIRVYYVTIVTPELTQLTDADIPLAGNMASLNVGVAVE